MDRGEPRRLSLTQEQREELTAKWFNSAGRLFNALLELSREFRVHPNLSFGEFCTSAPAHEFDAFAFLVAEKTLLGEI